MTNNIVPAMIFQDHMILQRHKAVRVWGRCGRDTKITVRLQGQEAEVISTEGRWEVTLPPMEACEQTEMEIFSEEEHITIRDVAIGEVWLAGGQSNMEFHMRYDVERDSAKANPRIRIFDYPEVAYEGQLEEGDYSEFGYWRECREKDLQYFSAVGYYFAMQLEARYHVPIGILGCNWGGTPACAWMDPEYLKGNAGKIWLEDYEKCLAELDCEAYEKAYRESPDSYRGKPFENEFQDKIFYGASVEEITQMFTSMTEEDFRRSALLELGPKSEKRPGGVYRSMLCQVAPYTVRGVLWYQGENDDKHADVYHVVLKELIHCWRDLWEEQLPFLIVGLAPFASMELGGKNPFYVLRSEQEWVSRNVENVWMASIMDAGMRQDIHPKRKRPVGERLALLARGHVYGEDILCDAPVCDRMTVETGKITLHFVHAGDGLALAGERCNALEITADGKELTDYALHAGADQIEVCSDKITKDSRVKVLFAWQDYCEVNLYNSAGLSAAPFIVEHGIEESGGQENV